MVHLKDVRLCHSLAACLSFVSCPLLGFFRLAPERLQKLLHDKKNLKISGPGVQGAGGMGDLCFQDLTNFKFPHDLF